MTGVVDVGGGLRGALGAGVFDWCLDHNVSFDYYIGVSAGSANVAAFVAGQKGRNLKFYSEYCYRSAYMSFKNYIRTGSYLDLEYIYGEALTNSRGEYPLDYEMLEKADKPVKIVATDAVNGKPVYFDLRDMDKDDYGAIKASSCVPVVNKPYYWKGTPYYDGGISDPIPYEKAFEAGCDKVVIILTRPKDYERSAKKDIRMAKLLKKNPVVKKVIADRYKIYNEQLCIAKRYENMGKVLIIAPDDIMGMSTFKKDRDKIMALYGKGTEKAESIMGYIMD